MTSKLKIVFLAGLLVGALPVIMVQAQSAEDAASTPEVVTADASTTPSTSTATGEVAGESTETVPQDSSTPDSVAPPAAQMDIATSTTPVEVGTSTPPAPILTLQPDINLQIGKDSLKADIVMENLTCKSCAMDAPATDVKVYYTAWYPNDGPSSIEVGGHSNEQTFSTYSIVPNDSQSFSWSTSSAIPPGHYYFVVVTDPENANGLYRMQRTEFTVN